MEREWKIKLDGRRWSYNKIVSEILRDRDIINLDRFLYPIEEDMLPLESLKNIKEAGDIVANGIREHKRFFVYFDSDTDGVCGGTIMTRYLLNFLDNPLVTPYINQGKQHGLRYEAACFHDKYDVVIIVDSIETDTVLYEELLRMGSEVVVLDHHDLVPAIRNMQHKIHLVSSMNEYENPQLCGAGVALKFCLYLDQIFNTTYASSYFDLAACGICADMMSVGTDSLENRYICYTGFENLVNPAIIKIKGSYEMSSTTVSFGIAPLVNAANRMNENWAALNLFMSDDPDVISDKITILKQCRQKQNERVEEAYQKVEAQAREQKDKKVMFFVIDESDGISGLLANKILGQYQRPVIMTKETVDAAGDEVYSGSIRAVGVDNFSTIINKTRYAQAMGHSNAAGFTMKKKYKEKFTQKIEEQLKDVEFKEQITVDIQLLQSQINKDLISWLKSINRISGQGFPPVTVMVDDVVDYKVESMSGGRHTKIVTPHMLFIKWNSDDWEFIPEDMSISAIGTLDQGCFGKKFYLQMIMTDYRVEEKIEIDDI